MRLWTILYIRKSLVAAQHWTITFVRMELHQPVSLPLLHSLKLFLELLTVVFCSESDVYDGVIRECLVYPAKCQLDGTSLWHQTLLIKTIGNLCVSRWSCDLMLQHSSLFNDGVCPCLFIVILPGKSILSLLKLQKLTTVNVIGKSKTTKKQSKHAMVHHV